MSESQSRRYHHGDLRRALVDAGLELTRAGGPASLGIREVTRRVGVSPNAAYRHFADRQALLDAVAGAIQDGMAHRMHDAAPDRDAVDARDALRAVGLGYLRFALDEPGWFSVAFFGEGDAQASDVTAVEPPAPFTMLVEALDALERDGLLSPERREGAEWPCFAAVHGYAALALHGPLRHMPRDVADRWAARTVDDVIAGVLSQPDAPAAAAR